MLDYINQKAQRIDKEMHKLHDNTKNIMFMTTLGSTKDKRILFDFNPKKQSEEFFNKSNFSMFSEKILNYMEKFFDENLTRVNNSFILFADKKIIITIIDKEVSYLLDLVIKEYEEEEMFERCAQTRDVKEKWMTYVNNKKKPIPKDKDDS